MQTFDRINQIHFFLGTHLPSWLAQSPVPLFVSHSRLRGRRTLPRAIIPWALDSGGFTEVTQHLGYRDSPKVYAQAIRRYQEEIGQLQWAAPQDWMCEIYALGRTGLTTRQHQEKTVQNFLDLKSIDPTLPVIPVLQGYSDENPPPGLMDRKQVEEVRARKGMRSDYRDCIDIYTSYGVDLRDYPLVGLGTVCRRQNLGTPVLLSLDRQTYELQHAGVRFHGFGFKATGLEAVEGMHFFGKQHGHRPLLGSADSMAWSFAARRDRGDPRHPHKKCSSCLVRALEEHWKIMRNTVMGPKLDDDEYKEAIARAERNMAKLEAEAAAEPAPTVE